MRLTSSSAIHQGRVRLSPKDMHPKMGTEIVRPLFPRVRYSHLELSTDSWRALGIDDILSVVYCKVTVVTRIINESLSIWYHNNNHPSSSKLGSQDIYM